MFVFNYNHTKFISLMIQMFDKINWLVAIGVGIFLFFNGCESKEEKEKKKQQTRIRQLESDVNYLSYEIEEIRKQRER